MQGWLLVLSGHKFDLEDWQIAFPADYDPIAVAFENEVLLSSTELTNAKDVGDAYNIGMALLPRLNGLMGVLCGAEPLSMQAVGKFDDTGNLKQHVFMSAQFRGRSRFTARAVLFDANGEEVQPVPKPTVAQEMAKAADNDELLDDALHYASESQNWFNLYKAFECIAKSVGGEANLKKLKWATGPEISLFKQTANSLHRHRKSEIDPPSNPMSNKDAVSLLRRLIRKSFDQSNSGTV